MKVGSFFAGVGGIDLGFQQAGFEIVYANEIDPYPVMTYEANFDLKVDCRDINEVKGFEIPNFDVMVGGFPCQAFSIAGKQKGFMDERGILFFQLCRIIKEKRMLGFQPKIVLFENVKNLIRHDNGKTFDLIIKCLQDLGYRVKTEVLNSCEYGNVPQNRERVYIVGFLKEKFARKFKFPNECPLTNRIEDVIDFDRKVNRDYYYVDRRYNSNIYDKLVEAIDDDSVVYQFIMNKVRKCSNHLVPTLTASMGEAGHRVCIINTKNGIRKMTPRECFNTQGFPRDFILPNISDGKLYKQAGNSVTVSVIKRIATQIAETVA